MQAEVWLKDLLHPLSLRLGRMSANRRLVAASYATAVAVAAADVASKVAIRQLLPDDGAWLTSWLGLSLVENSGLGFGLPVPAWLATALATAAAIAVAWWVTAAGKLERWPVALLLGGAIGNIVDRLADGTVTDFVVLGPWPSFNLADASLTVGVAWLTWLWLRGRSTAHSSAEELLDVVDESNVPTGISKPRSAIHAANTEWHRTTVIWIANARGEVLCQRRSPLKDQQPGLWQSYFGGHLKSGQTYEQNAVTELREELGLEARAADLHPIYVRKVPEGPHFGQVYLLRWNGESSSLKFNDGEVAEVRWVPLATLEQLIAAGKFCNRFDPRVADLIEQLRQR